MEVDSLNIVKYTQEMSLERYKYKNVGTESLHDSIPVWCVSLRPVPGFSTEQGPRQKRIVGI